MAEALVSGKFVDIGRVDVNSAILDLMDVARVALQPDMGQLPEPLAVAALSALIDIIDQSMADDLQQTDRRVMWGRKLLEVSRPGLTAGAAQHSALTQAS